MDQAVRIADLFCKNILQEYHNQIPIFTYGRLSPSGQRLRDIRRSLQYFKSHGKQVLEHDINRVLHGDTSISLPSPSYGRWQLHDCYDSKKGIMCVGVVPFVQNYNIQVIPVYPEGNKTNNDVEKSVKSKIAFITKSIRSPDVSLDRIAFMQIT